MIHLFHHFVKEVLKGERDSMSAAEWLDQAVMEKSFLADLIYCNSIAKESEAS